MFKPVFNLKIRLLNSILCRNQNIIYLFFYGVGILILESKMLYDGEIFSQNKRSRFFFLCSHFVIFSIFFSAVLNYLDLALGHSQGISQPRSFRPRQIFSLFKSLFQREYLLSRKCRPRVFPFAIFVQ